MPTFGEAFTDANRLLRFGRRNRAALRFQEALSLTQHNTQEALQANHIAGVACRMAGQPELALRHFDAAETSPHCTNLRRGAIRRDRSMVYAAQGQLTEALKEAKAAASIHGVEALNNAPGAQAEYGASLSFIARIYMAMGKKASAGKWFELADKELRSGDNPVYLMNHIIWWAADSAFPQRQIKSWQALQLALQTGHLARAAEALLVMAGKPKSLR